MSLQFEKPTTTVSRQPQAAQQQNNNSNLHATKIGIPFCPIGVPPGFPEMTVANILRAPVALPPLAMPGANLPRAVNYYADYGGCGFWRMIFPELLLNGNQKAIINGLTTMVLDERFYGGIKAVRLQRQATPIQLEFLKFLKAHSQNHGFKVIYEIDDIIFKDDIPNFNRCKVAFEDEAILRSAIEMMQLSDEVSVTCDYMRNYYIDKTGNKKITVIPNYPPKMWAANYYDPDTISRNYNKNKKRPRIAYCGSGTHIDVTNRTNQNDDFTHVVQSIIKTRKDFKWVFMGCYPLPVKPFIDNGEMEFINWSMLMEYPLGIKNTEAQITYAPLMDCHFNRAKSNIKYLESACVGIPGVYQDIVTYQMAPYRFKTGDDLVDQIKSLVKDKDTYMKASRKARAYAETMWLDDHLDEYMELYFTNFGSSERKALLNNNPN